MLYLPNTAKKYLSFGFVLLPLFLLLFLLLFLHFSFSSTRSSYSLFVTFNWVQTVWESKQKPSLSLFLTYLPIASRTSCLLGEPHPFPTFLPHLETLTLTPFSFVSDFQLFSPTSVFCLFFLASPVYFSFRMSLRSILYLSINSKWIHALLTSLFWESSLTCLPVVKVSPFTLRHVIYMLVLTYYSHHSSRHTSLLSVNSPLSKPSFLNGVPHNWAQPHFYLLILCLHCPM